MGRKISSRIPQVGGWGKEKKKLKQVPYHIKCKHKSLSKNMMAHKEGKNILTPQHSKVVTTIESSG